MTQQIFSTGAYHYYTGTGGASSPIKAAEYLGTSVGKPSIQIFDAKEQVHADIAGGQIAFDHCWQGQYGVISVTLSRFEHAVLNRLMTSPDWVSNTKGSWATTDVGTMLAQENKSYPLWITFPRQTVTAMSSLKPGYRFWNCVLAPGSPINLAGGTTHFQPTLTWYAFPAFTESTYPGANAGLSAGASPIVGGSSAQFILYDHTMVTSSTYGSTTAALSSVT